jgi:hypothetical protein
MKKITYSDLEIYYGEWTCLVIVITLIVFILLALFWMALKPTVVIGIVFLVGFIILMNVVFR